MPRALKSTARLWAQSKSSATRYRDHKRVTLPDGTRKELFGYGPTKDRATADLAAKVEAAEKEHPAADTIRVRDLFAEFVQHKRAVRGNKAKTTLKTSGCTSPPPSGTAPSPASPWPSCKRSRPA